jgi:tetratricopeptide (TPR) repeat protein
MRARDLESQVARAADDSGRLAALLELAAHQASTFRLREGLLAAKAAIEIARCLGDRIAEGRALASATWCHYHRGDFAAAMAAGLDALDALSAGTPGDRARALQSLALALLATEAFDPAESAAAQAVSEARRGKDIAREAPARAVLGFILADAGRFEEARSQFRLAARRFRALGDTARVKRLVSDVGHAHRKQGTALRDAGYPRAARQRWRQALRVYRVALAAGELDADDAIILGSMGECACRLGDSAAARLRLEHALQLARSVANPRILADCHLWTSHALRLAGDLDGAEREADEALRAAARLEGDADLADYLRAAAIVQERLGRHERARELRERASNGAAERSARLERLREELVALWERHERSRRSDKLPA